MAVSACMSLQKDERKNSSIQFLPYQANETGTHGTKEFPVGIYESDLSEALINWHWHEEIEVVMVLDGSVLCECGNQKFTLSAGDIFFINSGVLHSMVNNASPSKAKTKTITFHGSLISGNEGSIFFEKYLKPVLTNENLRELCIAKQNRSYLGIVAIFEKVWSAIAEEKVDYEIITRNELSNLFSILLHFPENNLPIVSENRHLQEDRAQMLLDYIHRHYMDSITLDDLAQAVSVSKSEILRSFKAIIGLSPIKYLKNYRLQMAAYMLKKTDYTIGTIYELCGFDDNSYFSKSFKEVYHCTPREYRGLFGGGML